MQKNKIQRRYIYRFFCTALLCMLASGMFFVAWYGFVFENNHTGFLLGIGNLGMAIGIYFIFYLSLLAFENVEVLKSFVSLAL